MQDYLLRKLIEDQKMDEKEKGEQMAYLETKGHETDRLRTESDVWIENEMLNDKEKEEFGKQEIHEQIKELEKRIRDKKLSRTLFFQFSLFRHIGTLNKKYIYEQYRLIGKDGMDSIEMLMQM
ncbi:unnamed protein product [Parnassius apollo]|uniref:(apollo) hypothetical protein n=1 Tax=Parnassius apollo TaxID=110799 RepID=A0A8S3XGX5_PARAO|nr:unnamed protein product [Parnassius apollo]